MYCEKISLKNYRNVENAEISLTPEINVLYGENAQGKTNILEAVYYFAYGKSFRLAKDKELIRFGESAANIKIEFTDKDRKRNHEVRFFDSSRKICLKENIKISRLSEFIGVFRAVLFSPEHLSVVKDGPSERRNFEDIAISQLYPAYMSSISRYQKTLQQRNSLLKEPESYSFNDMLYVYSEQLATEAAFISEYRERYTERLSCVVSDIIKDMTCGRENVKISYGDRKSKEEYLRLLTENTEKEIHAGATLYGSHKDDIYIELNGKDSRSFASQGQQRSIALAMKLAEGEISREITGEYPVFLFDDILSELDKNRKSYILSGLTGKQVIITCCEETEVGNIYTVKNGLVRGVPAGEPPVANGGRI